MTTELFPLKLSFGATGGAQFSTEIITCASGSEQRISKWSYPKARYNVQPALQSREDIIELVNFYNAHRGRGLSFRFRDFCDCTARNQLIWVSTGIETKLQLIKTYNFGNKTLNRKITKPVAASLRIHSNSKDLKFECNFETGEIVLYEIPDIGEQVLADFEFEIEARFDIDHLEISPDPMHNYKEIPIIEILN